MDDDCVLGGNADRSMSYMTPGTNGGELALSVYSIVGHNMDFEPPDACSGVAPETDPAGTAGVSPEAGTPTAFGQGDETSCLRPGK